MLFQAKEALVFKAMYQSAFFAREKVLNFDGWLSDFNSTTLKFPTNQLKLEKKDSKNMRCHYILLASFIL